MQKIHIFEPFLWKIEMLWTKECIIYAKELYTHTQKKEDKKFMAGPKRCIPFFLKGIKTRSETYNYFQLYWKEPHFCEPDPKFWKWMGVNDLRLQNLVTSLTEKVYVGLE